MELLRQLAVQQLQTLEIVSFNNLPKIGDDYVKNCYVWRRRKY